MKRVETDTRRKALMPRSEFLRLACLVTVSFCAFTNNVNAQRPFPEMDANSFESASPAAYERTPAPATTSLPDRPTDTGISKPVNQVPAQRTAANIPPGSVTRTGHSSIQQVEFSIEEILDTPLQDVLIEGNTTILPNAILRYIETKPGRASSARLIQQDVTRLLNTRWFLTVHPFYRQTDAGPVLVFQVKERPIVRSVKFEGNKKIKDGELQAQTGLRPGHGFDVAANLESVGRIKSLYQERGYRFAEVTLQKGGDKQDRDVVFLIKEGHKVRIWDIDFVGQKNVRGDVLQTKLGIKTVKLWVIGGDYDPQLIRGDVQVLKQYYMSLGFFDVDVDFEEEFYAENSKVRVTFKVNEGIQYKVGGIDLIGNELIGRDKLLAKLDLPPGDFFNARHLRTDVTTMKDHYDDIGHMFASVEPTPHFREDEPGVVDLIFQIDEDTPRFWGTVNVHIRGDHPHTQEELVRQQLNQFIKPGKLARGRDYRMAQTRVQGSQIWDRADPPTFNITPTEGLEYLPSLTTRGQSEERTNFTETGAVYLPSEPARIFGHGTSPLNLDATTLNTPRPAPVRNTVTPAAQQTIQQNVGQPLRGTPVQNVNRPQPLPATQEVNKPSVMIDPELIFRSQSPADFQYVQAQGQAPGAAPVYRGQTLDQFGNPVPQDYLQSVSPQGDPYGDALNAPPIPGFVDVNVDVTEGRTGRLMFGVGVNSDAGVVGSLVLQEDNFDILRVPRSFADIVNGQAWRGAGQSFRLEAVPGSEVSRYMLSWQDPYFLRTDFSLGVSAFYYNRFYQDWTEDRLGGRVSLGYVLNKFWSVSGAVRLEDVQIRDFRATAPIDIKSVGGSNFLSTGSATASFDTRDSSFNPSKGNFVDFTVEQAFGEFDYTKLEMSGGQYFTTYERPDGFGKHIFSLTGQLAGTSTDTPVFERFYAGGYSSFRGFEFRGVSPRKGGARVGGNFMALGSAEYMIPLTASDNIRAVLFSDFGTVEPEAGFDAFRATAGFGFRLIIPAMGPAPLAFDFAWPITKQTEDDTRVFSFYVGFTK